MKKLILLKHILIASILGVWVFYFYLLTILSAGWLIVIFQYTIIATLLLSIFTVKISIKIKNGSNN